MWIAVKLMTDMVRSEGPDLPSRIVSDPECFDFECKLYLYDGASTPMEALSRVHVTFNFTHVEMKISSEGRLIRIAAELALPLCAEATHVVEQYAVAVVGQMFKDLGVRGRLFEEVVMAEHPSLGFSHLEDRYEKIVAASGKRFSVLVSPLLAERPYPFRLNRFGPDLFCCGVRMGYDVGAQSMLIDMFEDGPITIDRLVASSGKSRKTMERRCYGFWTSPGKVLAAAKQTIAERAELHDP